LSQGQLPREQQDEALHISALSKVYVATFGSTVAANKREKKKQKEEKIGTWGQ